MSKIFTDGNCGLSWDDSIITGMTPTPSARCPFEYFHKYDEDGYCPPLRKFDIPDDFEVTPVAEGGQEPDNRPKWYDDRDKVVAFARWFWEGTFNSIGTTGEILDYFEKPWKFDEEYRLYREETT